MPVPQPSPVPPAGAKLCLRDPGWLVRYSARGLAELVRARLVFARLDARDVLRRNRAAQARTRAETVANQAEPARISYVISRISRRLPWRSDCLIQAVAGQNWLAAKGLASETQIGTEISPDSGFGAHASLMHHGCIVSGGDISAYERLLGERAPARDTHSDT